MRACEPNAYVRFHFRIVLGFHTLLFCLCGKTTEKTPERKDVCRRRSNRSVAAGLEGGYMMSVVSGGLGGEPWCVRVCVRE